jgi:F-type H+-transporting ATPase subunit b
MAEQIHAAVQPSGEHTKVFPPLDPNTYASQLIWLAITFGLLYLMVRRIFLPRVDAILEDRSGRIKGDFAATEKLKRDMEVTLATYQDALRNARTKADGVAKGMREKLAAETDTERARIEAHIAAMLAEAENRIEAAKSKALASVGEIASDVASAVVARLIGKEVTTDEVKRAVAQPAAVSDTRRKSYA